VEGELVSRKRLEELAPEQFSSILILADESATFSTRSDAEGAADSDSRNLATLLLLRDLQTKRMCQDGGLTRLHSASFHQKIRPSERNQSPSLCFYLCASLKLARRVPRVLSGNGVAWSSLLAPVRSCILLSPMKGLLNI
jgi:hypothetical protein